MAEAINPILTNITRDEVISDPFVREAYFGSPDTPGIISQAITAANRAFGQPAILRQTAGLSPLELAAMQGAYGGLGSYQPYLDASTRAYQEGMGMSRRAGELAQPYFAGEQAYLGAATDTARRAAGMQFDPNLTRQFFDPFDASTRAYQEGMGMSRRAGELAQPYFAGEQAYLGAATDTARRAAGMQFDPNLTRQFFDPFEDRVVQQTIDDVFKQGEIQDVAQRARDIQTGGESAFGSRARLTADERRAALGRGLGEALAGIRSRGFGQAQQAALGEFGRQAGARERLAGTLAGFGTQLGGIGGRRAGLARTIGSDVAGYGAGIGGLVGQAQQAALGEFGRQAGARERLAGTLAGFGTQLGGIGGRRAGLARTIGSDVAGYGAGIGGLGRDVVDLGIRSRGELAGLGATARGLVDTALGREYEQAVQTRMAPTQAAQVVRGFLPTYQSGRTQVATTYGAPVDPLTQGLGTFLNTYANFANPQTPTSSDPESTAATAGGAATPAVIYGNPYGQYNPYTGGGTYTA